MRAISVLLFPAVMLACVNGANILMISAQIRSHIMSQLTLGQELVAAGHQVYIAIGSLYPDPEAIEKLGIKPLMFQMPSDVLYMASLAQAEQFVSNQIFNGSGMTAQNDGIRLSAQNNRDCTYAMEDESFIDNAKKVKFDITIVEPFILGMCTLILPYRLGIPFISMTNAFFPFSIRSPALPSFYPRYFLSLDDREEITFATRLAHTIINILLEVNYPFQFSTNTSLLERYAPGVSTWKELMRKSELFLFEVDHHYNAPLPSFPNFISVAGLTCKSAKILPTDLENIVQKTKEGVILMSFGTAANYLPKEIIAKFLEVFTRLNQTVLAKFVIPVDIEIPDNVKIQKWLPQNDILGHPKTKLFITHSGNNGQHEALYHGVPMIMFPLFAEQPSNTHRAHMKGFGLPMDIHSFTVDQLFDNIQEVVNNPKYGKTIKRASDIFRSQPMTAQQRAIFWIEHVIKYGGKHLRSSAMDLPLYQFFMFDVIAFLLAVVFALVCCAKFILLKLLKTYRVAKSKVKLN